MFFVYPSFAGPSLFSPAIGGKPRGKKIKTTKKVRAQPQTFPDNRRIKEKKETLVKNLDANDSIQKILKLQVQFQGPTPRTVPDLGQKVVPPPKTPAEKLFSAEELNQFDCWDQGCPEMQANRPWRPWKKHCFMQHWQWQPSSAQGLWQSNQGLRQSNQELRQPDIYSKPYGHWQWQQPPSRDSWGSQVCSDPRQVSPNLHPQAGNGQGRPISRTICPGQKPQKLPGHGTSSQRNGFLPSAAQVMCQNKGANPSVSLSKHQPFFLNLRKNIHWWKENNCSQEVLRLIENGVSCPYPLPSQLSKRPCIRSQEETHLALQTIQEYLAVGAVRQINLQEAKHLIPWFVIKKGEKLRLITDCREMNTFLEPK